MKEHTSNANLLSKLLFRLLPIQILLAAVGAVNGIVSSYFATNYIGVVTTIVVFAYAWQKGKRFPRSMDELMTIPADFGAPADERMDLTVRSMEDVLNISRQVQDFCMERGVDSHRAYIAALAMEEMAGNIVDHGFSLDKKRHSVDVRVARKGDDVILRIKDDCARFDPGEQQKLAEGDDVTKNIGLRMVFSTAREVQYLSILGLNVLTIRI